MAGMAVLAYLSRVLRLILKLRSFARPRDLPFKRSGPMTSHILCTERRAYSLSCIIENQATQLWYLRKNQGPNLGPRHNVLFLQSIHTTQNDGNHSFYKHPTKYLPGLDDTLVDVASKYRLWASATIRTCHVSYIEYKTPSIKEPGRCKLSFWVCA